MGCLLKRSLFVLLLVVGMSAGQVTSPTAGSNATQCAWSGTTQTCDLSGAYIVNQAPAPGDDALAASLLQSVAANALCGKIVNETACTGNCSWSSTSVSQIY